MKTQSPGQEVVMLTGYETLDAAKTALRRGACDFLSKPVELATLRQAVGRAVRLRMASEAAEKIRIINSEFKTGTGRISEDHFLIQAGVLHDIRNLQTVLGGYITIIDCAMDGLQGNGGATAKEVRAIHSQVKEIAKASETAMELLSRFLSFASKSLEDSTQRANISVLARDLKTVLRTHPGAKNARFAISQPDDSKELVVHLSANDAIRILLNILLNAAQSTRKEQVISIHLAEVKGSDITLGDSVHEVSAGGENIVPSRSYVVVNVTDEGPGIAEAQLGRLLEAHHETTKSGGTGLGVGIVRYLVVENRGMVRIKSRAGHGTTFTFALPGHSESPRSELD
jgi:signal transduction histidine kinase